MNLATVETIKNKREHPNADKLDLVDVLGYTCIVQKGLYNDGDVVIYVRTDTILPDSEWCSEYKKYSPKRVKAVNLRGLWSEGIIIPFSLLEENNITINSNLGIGDDISNELGIIKFDPPKPIDDNFLESIMPYDIPRTNEMRFEEFIKKTYIGVKGDIFLKIDGESTTFGYNIEEDKNFGTSRKNELDLEKENSYTIIFKKYNLHEKIKAFNIKNNINLALRGEIFQGKLFIFSVYNFTERKYERKGSKYYFLNVCKELDLPTVPLIEEDVIITEDIVKKYSVELTKIDGIPFEGVVIQTPEESFKIINKNYDSKK